MKLTDRSLTTTVRKPDHVRNVTSSRGSKRLKVKDLQLPSKLLYHVAIVLKLLFIYFRPPETRRQGSSVDMSATAMAVLVSCKICWHALSMCHWGWWALEPLTAITIIILVPTTSMTLLSSVRNKVFFWYTRHRVQDPPNHARCNRPNMCTPFRILYNC